MIGIAALRDRLVASLRARLFLSLVLAIGVASLALGLVAYRAALSEANDLFDYNMRQMALSLRSGNPLSALPSGIENESGWQGIDFAVQVVTAEGVRLFASSRDLVLPQRPIAGFSDVDTPRGRFRIFAEATPSRVIQVAQDLSIRERLARQLAWRTIRPVALLLPLLLLVVWWVVTASLRPVARARDQLAKRAADDLSPIRIHGLPDELRPLVDELNDLLARLRAAFDAQRHFVADAAHELRSPLAALRLQLQVLRQSDDAAAREAAGDRLNAGIDRAAALVDQLLLLARHQDLVRSGAMTASVDLMPLVRDAVIAAATESSERQIDLGLEEGTPRSALVRGDRDALAILIGNLLSNAGKYTPAGGVVDVSVRVLPDGSVAFAVDDSGPGIALAERERVFDRFYRGPEQATSVPGNGLGLAIVRSIAERHGAVVSLADSATRGGLHVEVRFPPVR